MSATPRWWGLEAKVTERSRGFDPELTRLCDESQDIIALVLDSPRFATGDSLTAQSIAADLSDGDRAIVLATNQGFSSLRAAWGLAFAGYPAQALSLVRLAHEWNVVIRYAHAFPQKVNQLFEAKISVGKLASTLGMVGVEGERFERMRTSLNQFAHHSGLSLSMTLRLESDGQNALHLGPFIDRDYLREVGYELLACSTLIIAELTRWHGSFDQEWMRKAVEFYDEVNEWLRSVRPPPGSV